MNDNTKTKQRRSPPSRSGATSALAGSLLVLLCLCMGCVGSGTAGPEPLLCYVGGTMRPAVEALRAIHTDNAAINVHFGPVASGDEDIMAAERRRQLHEQTAGLVAAWEGAGGARACAFSGLPYLEVRGVTDAADAGAATAFEDNLETAMNHIADLLLAWLG